MALVLVFCGGNTAAVQADEVDKLINQLKSDNPEVRKEAAEGLTHIKGHIKAASAVEPLIATLKDKDSGIRYNAAHALGKIGDNRAVGPLIAVLLKDIDGSVRASAAEALGHIGDKGAVEPLILALKDTSEGVRYSVAHALGMLGDKRAVDPLIVALNDSCTYVRWNAAEALGKIRDKKAAEPLIAALKDANPDVRRLAANALSELGEENAVEVFIVALKNENSDVRREAIRALEAIGDGRAIEPLIAALMDKDEGVRIVSADALRELTGEKLGQDTEKWQEWWEENKGNFVDIDFNKIAREAIPAVVQITTYDANSQKTGVGSGFFINNEGEIATNYGLVKDASFSIVKTAYGKVYKVNDILRFRRSTDVAIFKIKEKSPKFLTLCKSFQPRFSQKIVKKQKLIVVGKIGDDGKKFTVTTIKGIVHVESIDEEGGWSFMMLTTPLSKEDSGRPVLNGKGEVIGITTTFRQGDYVTPVIFFPEHRIKEEPMKFLSFYRFFAGMVLCYYSLKIFDYLV